MTTTKNNFDRQDIFWKNIKMAEPIKCHAEFDFEERRKRLRAEVKEDDTNFINVERLFDVE